MVPFIRDELGRICDRYTQETNVSITPTARDLAAEIISAILEDPHSSWKVERSQTMDYVGKYLSEFPGLLNEIRKQQNAEKHITAFDLLHWLTRVLDKICLIPK